MGPLCECRRDDRGERDMKGVRREERDGGGEEGRAEAVKRDAGEEGILCFVLRTSL
jgi:hypothetical protein